MLTNQGVRNKWRTIGGHRDSIRAYNSATTSMLDIGFDLATTGVESLGNITAFGLFPNPSTDGRFNISFSASLPVREAVITVANVAGQVILKKQYHAAGNSFFGTIDLPASAKGVYFVTLAADDALITRQVVVE